MKNRTVDAVIGLLLFGCGIFFAFWHYAWSHVLSDAFPFLGSPDWRRWAPPVALGCAAALAAIGLCFRRIVPGIIGSLSMLSLAVLSLRSATDQVTLELWDKNSVNFPEFLITTGPMLLIGALVYWRFVLRPRANMQTV